MTDSPVPNFSRVSISNARDRAMAQQGDSWLVVERPDFPVLKLSSASKVCDTSMRRWTAAQVLAIDDQQLESAAEELCRALALSDSLMGVCPVCGGRPINLGPIVTPLLKLAKHIVGDLVLSHTEDCPVFAARRIMVRLLEGEEAADRLAHLVVVKETKP